MHTEGGMGGGCSRKNPNRGVEDVLFETPPGIFHFLNLPPGNSRHWIFHKIVLGP